MAQRSAGSDRSGLHSRRTRSALQRTARTAEARDITKASPEPRSGYIYYLSAVQDGLHDAVVGRHHGLGLASGRQAAALTRALQPLAHLVPPSPVSEGWTPSPTPSPEVPGLFARPRAVVARTPAEKLLGQTALLGGVLQGGKPRVHRPSQPGLQSVPQSRAVSPGADPLGRLSRALDQAHRAATGSGAPRLQRRAATAAPSRSLTIRLRRPVAVALDRPPASASSRPDFKTTNRSMALPPPSLRCTSPTPSAAPTAVPSAAPSAAEALSRRTAYCPEALRFKAEVRSRAAAWLASEEAALRRALRDQLAPGLLGATKSYSSLRPLGALDPNRASAQHQLAKTSGDALRPSAALRRAGGGRRPASAAVVRRPSPPPLRPRRMLRRFIPCTTTGP